MFINKFNDSIAPPPPPLSHTFTFLVPWPAHDVVHVAKGGVTLHRMRETYKLSLIIMKISVIRTKNVDKYIIVRVHTALNL